MRSRPAARVIDARRAHLRGYSPAAQARRDLDAFLVTLLTIIATMIALYDLLLLGTPLFR